MKMLAVLLIFISSFATNLFADDHARHVSHGMLLFGSEEVFADHIVYKEPHNFQVILKVEFDDSTKANYLAARADFPTDEIVFMLDPMSIGSIETAVAISGKIIHRNETGQGIVQAGITLQDSQFDVIYFNELPLSLAGTVHYRQGRELKCQRYPIVKCY